MRLSHRYRLYISICFMFIQLSCMFNSSTEEGKNTILISKLDEEHPDNKGFGCGYLTGIVSIFLYVICLFSCRACLTVAPRRVKTPF